MIKQISKIPGKCVDGFRSITGRYDCHAGLLLIVIAGYFPVAFQLVALKNDILQLDLPVKYYISRRLHDGEFPCWFYSWAGGFPLGHIFTWSIYNPVNLFFTLFFHYDVSVLHLEFVTYLFAGAVGFFVLAEKIMKFSRSISFLLAAIYILSGITLSCGQYMAYIAATGILPWVFYGFGRLLYHPSPANGLLFGLLFFLLCSWTYPATIIIAGYTLAAVFFRHLWLTRPGIGAYLKPLALSMLVVILLASPMIYATVRIWPYFQRTQGLTEGLLNYGSLHPLASFSMILPLSGLFVNHRDTALVFQNIFIGSAPVIILFACLLTRGYRERYLGQSLGWFLAALLYLFLSYGDVLPFKPLLNSVLPGFRLFRFPSYFRLFFLPALLLGIGGCFEYLKDKGTGTRGFQNKLRLASAGFLLCAIALVWLLPDWNEGLSIRDLFRPGLLDAGPAVLHDPKIFLVAEFLVALPVLLVFAGWGFGSWKRISALVMVDLLLNAWIMLPSSVISSYSLGKVSRILHLHSRENEQPVTVNNRLGETRDEYRNGWNSVNVYTNTITAAGQYVGPLRLVGFAGLKSSKPANRGLFFLRDDALAGSRAGMPADPAGARIMTDSVRIINNTFRHNSFSAAVHIRRGTGLTLFQLYYPGWKAYINDVETRIVNRGDGLMTIDMNPGDYEVRFVYDDFGLLCLTWLHFIVFLLMTGFFIGRATRRVNSITRKTNV